MRATRPGSVPVRGRPLPAVALAAAVVPAEAAVAVEPEEPEPEEPDEPPEPPLLGAPDEIAGALELEPLPEEPLFDPEEPPLPDWPLPELPANGSWYWLSPALWANACAQKSASSAVIASAGSRRAFGMARNIVDGVADSVHTVVAPHPALRMLLAGLCVPIVVWLVLGYGAAHHEVRGTALAPEPGRLEAAITQLRDARAHNHDTTPLLLEAQAYVIAHRNATAVPLLRRVVDREPANVAAWGLLAIATRDSGDTAGAAAARAEVARLSPLSQP
jgi:hypothetical protein